MRGRQRGTTTVEFAIVGLVMLVVLFAVLEFGRLLFTMNTLAEATRRGVRVAVVCPVNDPAPARAAVFADGAGASSIVTGLTIDNVVIDYLDQNGGVIADPVANFGVIRYVRARIVDFQQQLIIPLLMPLVQMPGFSATLPRESLGIPREGVVEPC